MFSNKFDDLIDSSNEENIISRCQNRNTTSLQLPATGKDRAASHFEPKERIEGIKKNTFDISFFY